LPSAGPAEEYQTYQVKAPKTTHWRRATCEEVDCPNFLHGFMVLCDESSEDGQRRAAYIRQDKSRECREQRGFDHPDHQIPPSVTVFIYTPGQTCFAAGEHRVPNGRQELYLVRGGDWRGNPRQMLRRHSGAQAWLDDFGEHQEKIADLLQKG
jgi:hypothetical protein